MVVGTTQQNSPQRLHIYLKLNEIAPFMSPLFSQKKKKIFLQKRTNALSVQLPKSLFFPSHRQMPKPAWHFQHKSSYLSP